MIQGCFKLPVATQSSFSLQTVGMEIDVPQVDFQYEGKQMFLSYELSLIATNNKEAGEKCQVDLDLDRKGSPWTKIIDHAEKRKQVHCNQGRCLDVVLGEGSLDGAGLYKGLLIKVPRD